MGWTDVFSRKKKEEPKERKLEDYISLTPEAQQQLDDLQNSIPKDLTSAQLTAVACLSVACFAAGFKAGRMQPPWRRFDTVPDISSEFFGPTAPYLRGRVLSVSDGDTVRFRHAPSRILHYNSSRLREDEKLSDVALPIRICTIDTPETAKFGNEGQPFGPEAKQHLHDFCHDKIVQVRLLQQDQYGRAVAEVRRSKWWFLPTSMSFFYQYADEIMLKAGLAEVYTGSGAVYGHRGKEAYVKMMEEAAAAKRGMWSQGSKRETAAEYKARLKAEK